MSPDSPSTIAVARRLYGSTGDDGVSIYADGRQVRADVTYFYHLRSITYAASGERLYGYNNASTGYEFTRLRIGPQGVPTWDVTTGLLSGMEHEIHFDRGLVYSDSGKVIDPERLTPVSTFPVSDLRGNRSVVPDSTTRMVYAAGGVPNSFRSVIRRMERDSFSVVDAVDVPLDYTGGMTITGEGRLAFMVGGYYTADGVFLYKFARPACTLRIDATGALDRSHFDFPCRPRWFPGRRHAGSDAPF